MLSDKRGQMTIFMLVGLLLVMGAGVYIYISNQTGDLSTETAIAEEVPLEIQPIKNYVESCMQDIGKEAILKLGTHGGYIDPLDSDLSGIDFKIDPSDPTESDAVTITGTPETAVVYWWYMSTPNTCKNCFVTSQNAPKKEEVETQIETYIKRKLDACLNNFVSFEVAGFSVAKLTEPDITVRITEDDVVALMDMTLAVTIGDRTSEMTRYLVHYPVGLRKILTLANEVVAGELSTFFLEKIDKLLISSYSGLDRRKLPPIFSSESGYDIKIWIKEVVDLQLKEIFTTYTSLIRFNDTKNGRVLVEPGDTGLSTAVYRNFFINGLLNDYSNHSLTFYSLDFPFYSLITPNKGSILTVSGGGGTFDPSSTGAPSFMPPLQENEYEFFYDISRPLIAEIRNTEAFRGDGYSFRFAMESNIRKNRDFDEWLSGTGIYGPWDASLISGSIDSESYAEEGFEQNPQVNLNVRSAISKLFCKEEHAISQNVTIRTIDSINGSAVERVKLKFGCGVFKTCGLGITRIRDDGNATYITNLPLCVNGGYLVAAKEGYVNGIVAEITTVSDEPIEIDVFMQKKKLMNLSFTKISFSREIIYRDRLDEYEGNYEKMIFPTGNISSLDDKDQIIVTISKKDDNALQRFPNIIISVDKNNMNDTQSAGFVPGIYDVDILYLRNDPITIAPELRTYEGEEVYVPDEPGIDIDTLPMGGTKLNNETGYWVIEPADLEGAGTINMTLLQFPKPLLVEDLDEISRVVNESKEYRYLLEPVFY